MLLYEPCCLLQTLLMLTILANLSVCALQRTEDTVQALSLSILSAYLSVGGMLLTALFLFPTSYFINSAANWGPLSNTTLLGSPCSFHTLSLNNLASPSANIPSIVATKCIIFDNLLQTTRIVSFSTTIGNFMIKSTVMCIHSFSGTSFNFSFPATSSVLFFIL